MHLTAKKNRRFSDTLSLHFYLTATTHVHHREREIAMIYEQKCWEERFAIATILVKVSKKNEWKLTCLIPNGQEEGSYWERIY